MFCLMSFLPEIPFRTITQKAFIRKHVLICFDTTFYDDTYFAFYSVFILNFQFYNTVGETLFYKVVVELENGVRVGKGVGEFDGVVVSSYLVAAVVDPEVEVLSVVKHF